MVKAKMCLLNDAPVCWAVPAAPVLHGPGLCFNFLQVRPTLTVTCLAMHFLSRLFKLPLEVGQGDSELLIFVKKTLQVFASK